MSTSSASVFLLQLTETQLLTFALTEMKCEKGTGQCVNSCQEKGRGHLGDIIVFYDAYSSGA